MLIVESITTFRWPVTVIDIYVTLIKYNAAMTSRQFLSRGEVLHKWVLEMRLCTMQTAERTGGRRSEGASALGGYRPNQEPGTQGPL